MSVNKLLVPKWKKRTHETHEKHQKEYCDNDYDLVFVGDSMTERWEWDIGGEFYLNKLKTDHKVATMGVGGDCIEHLLYRLQDERCIFDSITAKHVNIMIGTNNLERTSVDDIVEGVCNIIQIIILKQKPEPSITFFALPFRTDIENQKVTDVNAKIKTMIEKLDNPRIKFNSFIDVIDLKTDYADHVHFNTEGYQKWYEFLSK